MFLDNDDGDADIAFFYPWTVALDGTITENALIPNPTGRQKSLSILFSLMIDE